MMQNEAKELETNDAVSGRVDLLVMRYLLPIGYAVMAIPFALSVLWMMSILVLGSGLIGPYMFISDEGFGFWRTIILGTLFHAVMAVLFFSFMEISDKGKLNIDVLLGIALVEIVITVIYMVGNESGFSW